MSYYEEISRSKPKARKLHRCIWCGENIDVGEVYEYVAYKYMGDFQTNHFHLECVMPCVKECDEMDGEFMPYENTRGKTNSE